MYLNGAYYISTASYGTCSELGLKDNALKHKFKYVHSLFGKDRVRPILLTIE